MISTTYTVTGVTTAADASAIQDRLSSVARIGAVAIELVPGGGAKLILKHKEDVTLDRAKLAAALREAGDFTLR